MKKPRDELESQNIFLLDEAQAHEEEERENANHRDTGSDEFDDDTDIENDDRVRGAGRQSLDELAISREQGWGLEEGRGGLRADVPELTPEDLDRQETS